jgi:predicted MFS family arabinose efflux permease
MFGTLIRRYGYRRLYLAATFALILDALLVSIAPNVSVLVLAALLGAFANAIITPVSLAIATTELSPQASQRAMSYQIACIFVAIAVGIPTSVLVASLLGWRETFVLLATLVVLLLPFVWRIVPAGARDANARFGLATAIDDYRAILSKSSLSAIYLFLVLYVVCAFGAGAYTSALLVSRGANPSEVGLGWAVLGLAFVLSSVVAGEVLGKLRFDLRLVVLGGAVVFILAKGIIYAAPLSITAIIFLAGLASLCDGAVSVALRMLVASYPVRDRALSMVLFSTCESLGSAIGGVTAGTVLAMGGYPLIGGQVLLVGFVALSLPLVSRRLNQPAIVPATP